MGRIQYTQCTRCKGLFLDQLMTECFSDEDEEKWLADLCMQCIEGWEHFNAFVGDNE